MDDRPSRMRREQAAVKAAPPARLRRRSAARWCGCCTSRPTTSTARVGAPVELVGVAVRRLELQRDVDVPRELLTTDAAGPGRPRRRRPGGRGDRRHRAGPVADPRRARERRVGGHRQQGAARRGRRHAVRRRREGRARPLLRGRRRRRDPDPPAAARVAGRRPGHAGCSASSTAPPTSSSTRWTPPAPASPRRSRRPRRSGYAEADPTADVEGFDAAAKAAILASLAFHTRVTAADVYREGITEVTAADVASAREMGCVVKLLAICELRDGADGAGRLGARAPGDDPAVAPAGQRPRGLQRGVRRERGRRPADVLRPRRRRRADGERGARRPGHRRPQPARRRARGRASRPTPQCEVLPMGDTRDPLPRRARRRRPRRRAGRGRAGLRRARRVDPDRAPGGPRRRRPAGRRLPPRDRRRAVRDRRGAARPWTSSAR